MTRKNTPVNVGSKHKAVSRCWPRSLALIIDVTLQGWRGQGHGQINYERFKLQLFRACSIVSICLISCNDNHIEKIPSDAKSILSAEEELRSFEITDGLKVELVAQEPMVQDPIVIEFDEDGRLWVVEMKGFMPDIDGKGENDPVGRVSVLEDRDGDGRMDFSTIFLDSLIMPRALAVVAGGALIAENEALWFAADTDGDLKADFRTLIDKEYAGSSLVEHAGNGLWRGIDNWYYNAKSRFRYRYLNGEWKKDRTEFRGQWGISHDDEGRLIYNYNWSQLHADLLAPNYLSGNRNHKPTTGIDHGLTNDRRVYPIRDNPAVNRGYIPGTLDEKGRLKEFTSACSPFAYRATTLPSEFYGNVFVCEPSGNLVKRNIVKENGFVLNAFDPTPGKEFLASTDERFRPVFIASGPDGGLYFADMYRGLVQHGAHVTPYLREQTIKRNLVKPINLGRIWRIVPEGWNASKVPRLSQMSSRKLVEHLSSDNGWLRDISQRLLVERNEPEIIPILANLALNSKSRLGRFHALWTMEGMHALEEDLLLQLLDDDNILIKNTALKLLEPFANADRRIRSTIETKLINNWSHPKEMLQLALSSRNLSKEVSFRIFKDILEVRDSTGLLRDAILSSLYRREFDFLQSIFRSPTWLEQNVEKEIFLEALVMAMFENKDNIELETILDMLNTSNNLLGWKEEVILNSMSIMSFRKGSGPIVITKSPAIIERNDLLSKDQVGLIKSMFEWPGHEAIPFIPANRQLLNDEDQEKFVLGRQKYLSTCTGCHGTNGDGMNRLGPPLTQSEWVLGDEHRLILLMLHGIEGPIEVNGRVYDAPDILPFMPAHSTANDESIAAILTYIRNEWGNNASSVSQRSVGRIRHTSQGNVLPWTVNSLNDYIKQFNESKEADE